MTWAEEDIAILVERRSALLERIGHHRSPGDAQKSGGDLDDGGADLAQLRFRLAQVERYLGEAGLRFDP